MTFGLHRTSPTPWVHASQDGAVLSQARKPGWRLMLPTIPMRKRSYDIVQDTFVTGWWWFAVSLAVEPIGRNNGVSFRLTWGWVTSAEPDHVSPPQAA